MNKEDNYKLVVEGDPVVETVTTPTEAPEAENKKKGCLWPILIVILMALVFLLGRCTGGSSPVVHTTDGECAHCTIHCPCDHSSTRVEESEWTWTKVSEKGICRKGEKIVKTICTECEEVVAEETVSETDTEHDFNGNACKDCDYKKKSQSSSSNSGTQKPVSSCKHAETKTETSEWKWTEVGTESICQKASRTVKKICKDCNKTIDTDTESKTDGEHNFVDGKCKDCGYQKVVAPTECSHNSTKTETSEWKWTNVGTADTCQKAERIVKTICKDCGKTISEKAEAKVDDTHSYNGRTCTDCGYKKPLLEEGYVDIKGEIDAPNNSWDYVDDGEPAKPVE